MKARLIPWKEIISGFDCEYKGNGRYRVYHSSGTRLDKGPSLYIDEKYWPERVMSIQEDDKYDNRQLYRSSNGRLFYDEWFVWIGEEPLIVEPLPESLWDISDW